MDKTLQTMIDNLQKNTGKSLEQWVELVSAQNFAKHGEVIKFLKESHGMTHGYANLVAHTVKQKAEGPAAPEDLISKQYQGKEHWKPVYDHLISAIGSFAGEMEVAPKAAYVSLRRKKQFATLTPASKSRFEIGLNMKGHEPTARLVAEKPNAMCSHKINLTDIADIDEELIGWIRRAYEKAG